LHATVSLLLFNRSSNLLSVNEQPDFLTAGNFVTIALENIKKRIIAAVVNRALQVGRTC
jgi:hypothetical protein